MLDKQRYGLTAESYQRYSHETSNMVTAGQFQSRHLEKWNAHVFVLIGLLLAGVALYKGVDAFTAWTVSTVIDTGYGGLALITPFIGLLGLYPRVREAAPRLTAAGVVSSGLAAISVLAVWTWFFGTAMQLGRFPTFDEYPVWGAAALVLIFITLSVGFLSFGIAGLRSKNLQQSVSVLLVIPAVMYIGLLVNVAVRAIPELDFYVYVVNSLTVLTIGYLLWTSNQPASQVDRVSDSAA